MFVLTTLYQSLKFDLGHTSNLSLHLDNVSCVIKSTQKKLNQNTEKSSMQG